MSFMNRRTAAEIHSAKMFTLQLQREAGLLATLDINPVFKDGRWSFTFGIEDQITGSGLTIQEAASSFYKEYTGRTLSVKINNNNFREKISLYTIQQFINERTKTIMDSIQNVVAGVKQVIADAQQNAADAALVAKDSNDAIARVATTITDLSTKLATLIRPEDKAALDQAASDLGTISTSLQTSNKTLEDTAKALEAVDIPDTVTTDAGTTSTTGGDAAASSVVSSATPADSNVPADPNASGS